LAHGSEGSLNEFFESLRRQLPDDGILVTDSGLHQMAVRRWFQVRAPRGLILPSDFQSMGFGLPAAIGAAVAGQERKVVAVIGDGGMAMAGLELATAVREDLDLTVVVFNDGHLGQIRIQQVEDHGYAHATRLSHIEFGHLAEAVGASYMGLDGTNLHQLPEALENPGVTVVDLFLEDSQGMARGRARGLVKAVARRATPDWGWRFLKKVLG
jgi:acetolactate synthase-1/2/3 large subunit